jgi:hypothetical protein
MPAKVQASGDQDSGRKIITTIYTILSLHYGSHTFSTYSRMKIKKREVLAYKIGCTQSGYSTSAKLFASFSRFFCVKAHTI